MKNFEFKIGRCTIYFSKAKYSYTGYKKSLEWLMRYEISILKRYKNNTASIIFDWQKYLIGNWRALKNLVITIIISFIYWLINAIFNNCLGNLIQNNSIIQTTLIFLTIITLLNIFTSAGLKENFPEDKVKKIIKDETKNIMKAIEDEKRKINSYK